MPRTVSVRLLADVSNFTRNVGGNATKSVRDLSGELDKAAKAGRLDTVADGVGAVGLGLVGMAGYAVKASMDFEKSMSAVKAATHGSTAQMNQLREAALQAGKDTQYSATGAADAITELSKAGVATADVLNGGLAGALDLAAAGQLDVAEAAETAASAMTQFKLEGKEIPHVADLLSAAAGKAQGSVHDMGQALNQAGLIASQTGLTIEETTGGLAAFASAGLMGSDAGTSFKQMLLMLQAPSDKSKDLMDELGISLYDAQGKFIGLSKFAGQLKTALKDLTPEARAAAMAQIFGADATRAASIMYEQGADGIQQWIDKVNDAGYAQETAAALTDNLAGDIERLKGEIETLAIEAGSGANGGLRVLVQTLEGLVGAFSSMPSVAQSSITVLAGIGGAAALLAAGWVKSRRATAEFRAELEALGPAGEKAAAGLQKAQKAAMLATVAFVGLEVAGAVFDKMGNASVNVDRLTASLQEYAATGKMTEGLTESFGANLEDFGLIAQSANAATHGFWGALNDIESSIPGVSSVVDSMNESLYGTSFNDATERMKALDQSFTAFIGTQKDASAAGKLWNDLIMKSGLDTNQLAALLPGAWKGLQELQKASHGAAGGQKELAGGLEGATEEQKDYKTATEAATAATKGQRDALSQLSQFMKAEADPVFGLIAAQEKLAEAQKKATKAIKEHGKNSEEARSATRELALAAIDLQGSVGALGSAFNGKMTPALYATLRAAGLSRAEIKILEKQFKDAKHAAEEYDGKYEAKASAPGAKQAKKELDLAYTAGKMYDGSYVARLSITGDKPVSAKLDALLVKQRALQTGLSVSASRAAVQKDLDRNRQGGYYGGGRTAQVGEHEPAGVVHGKEFVFSARTVRRIDQQQPGFLDEVQATGQLPGYQNGGRVWPFRSNVSKTDIPSWEEVASKVGGNFGNWPRSPGAQRGDSGVWRKILALVKGSGIPYDFGNAYRPGDPKWHGSGRAIDFMGYNQDRLANFFMSRQNQVLELIHRTNKRDYGITRGHYNAMPTQWPLHRNHLHIAMAGGGVINEPVYGYGLRSGASYSFGERGAETVTPGVHNQGGNTTITLNLPSTAGINPVEYGRQVANALQPYLAAGGSINVRGKTVLSGRP